MASRNFPAVHPAHRATCDRRIFAPFPAALRRGSALICKRVVCLHGSYFFGFSVFLSGTIRINRSSKSPAISVSAGVPCGVLGLSVIVSSMEKAPRQTLVRCECNLGVCWEVDVCLCVVYQNINSCQSFWTLFIQCVLDTARAVPVRAYALPSLTSCGSYCRGSSGRFCRLQD